MRIAKGAQRKKFAIKGRSQRRRRSMRMRTIYPPTMQDPLASSSLVTHLGMLPERTGGMCTMIRVDRMTLQNAPNSFEKEAVKEIMMSIPRQVGNLCSREDGGINQAYARSAIRSDGNLIFDNIIIAYKPNIQMQERRTRSGTTVSYQLDYKICAFVIIDNHLSPQNSVALRGMLGSECENAVTAHVSLICAEQGQGFGRKIMDQVEQLVRDNYHECKILVLESVPNATGFYNKIGFQNIVDQNGPVIVDGSGELMYKQIR